jgi:hypothetical protein
MWIKNTQSGQFGTEKDLLPLSEIETLSLGCTALSQISILKTLTRIKEYSSSNKNKNKTTTAATTTTTNARTL